MNRFKKLIILVGIVCLPQVIFAGGVGTTGGQFLKILPSARGAALAGAFGAVSDDVYSIHWNPAGLAGIKERQVSFTYLKYFADINYGFAGYAGNSGGYAFGGGITYLVIDDIEARETDTAEPDRYFKARDMALTLSGAKHNAIPGILENTSLGASLKFISMDIDQEVAYTAALDLGSIYDVKENLKVGLALQNISWGVKFDEVTDPLPLNLKVGCAMKFPEIGLTVSGEIDEYIIDQKFYAALGAEYLPLKQLSLRGGYRFGYDTDSLGANVGLAGGIGFNIWNLSLDYAFMPFGDLGDTNRVTILAKF